MQSYFCWALIKYPKNQKYAAKLRKVTLNIILLFLMLTTNIWAKPDAIIVSERTASDTVDMGMCLIYGQLTTTFVIKNIGDVDLKFNFTDWTYALREVPGHPFEFMEFKEAGPLPNDIPAHSELVVNINYTANFGSSLPGSKTCILRLGVYDPAKTSEPKSNDDLVKYRDFTLVAHKASHAVEGYQKILDFDSVWVASPDTQKLYWTFQNNTFNDLEIKEAEFVRYTFSKINHNVFPPFTINKQDKQNHLITYQPRSRTDDRGKDTANLKLRYVPDPAVPDSTDSLSVSIYGVGIEQRLDILWVDSTATFLGNTIVVNDVPTGEYRDIKIAFQNNGNLPFGITSQKLLDVGSDIPAEGLTMIKRLSDNPNLLPTQIDTLIVRFQPQDRNSVYARYVVGSDIFSRKVHGAPDSVSALTFYIRGIGINPEISVSKDTVDFGNIIINKGDCPSFRDSLLPVSNNGNMFLKIKTIVLDPPYPATPFTILNENMDIPPKSTRYLRLRFDSLAKEAKPYKASMILISNSKAPKDTLRISLRAMGIYPDTTNLIIPNIKAKAGRRINIPILANKEKVLIAKSYSDTIFYDKTLLKFYSSFTSGTASEKLSPVECSEAIEGGKLYISIGNDFNRYFEKSDTLILLTFDTYLGEHAYSPIFFSQGKFGDGICSNILTTQVRSGQFTLDSICGLDLKLSKLPKSKFDLEVREVNIDGDYFVIAFNMPYQQEVEINLYNSLGNLVRRISSGNENEGLHIRQISVSELIAGVYYCEMKTGIFRTVKSVLIAK